MSYHETVAQLALSLDGYVCELDGNVDFLSEYSMDDFDFEGFVDTFGGLIMGSTTYLQAVEFGWIWHKLPTMVLTSQSDLPVPENADIRFAAMPTAEAIRSFSAETPKRLWVFGGGKVITEGLLGGAVDTLDMVVMPIALGSGLPLFTERYDGPMRLVEATPYSGGPVRLVYDTRPD